jgi:hypothetical protein
MSHTSIEFSSFFRFWQSRSGLGTTLCQLPVGCECSALEAVDSAGARTHRRHIEAFGLAGDGMGSCFL